MMILQSITGFAFIIFGIAMLISDKEIMFALLGMFAGFVLISLSKTVEFLQDMNDRSLGITLSERQIRKIIMKERRIPFRSNTLELYPDNGTVYPYFKLDGEYYLRAKLLLNYLSQNGSEYTIRLPGKEPVVLICSQQYRPKIEMFEINEQVYIRESSLGVVVKPDKDGVVIDIA